MRQCELLELAQLNRRPRRDAGHDVLYALQLSAVHSENHTFFDLRMCQQHSLDGFRKHLSSRNINLIGKPAPQINQITFEFGDVSGLEHSVM